MVFSFLPHNLADASRTEPNEVLRIGNAARIACVGQEVDERRKREPSLRKAWMWDGRPRIGRRRCIAPQHVEVDRARPIALVAHTAEVTLDRKQLVDDGDHRKVAHLDEDCPIEEHRLWRPHRLGLEPPRSSQRADARHLRDPVDRLIDDRPTIAEIAAHADHDTHENYSTVRALAFATPAPPVIAALTVVGFVAGLVDAIAGGGGVLTLPALMSAGLPAHLALGTNKGCSTFGTATATATFARKGRLQLSRTILGFLAGATGAMLGARLQLATSPRVLRPVVLVMLIAVAIILTVQRPKKKAEDDVARVPHSVHVATAIALALGLYDGFFGPGTGTFLIVTQVMLLHSTLSEATADAKPVNLGSNVASLLTFAIKGTVVWSIALPMAAGNILGGALGARMAMKGGDRLVRLAVIGVSLMLVAKLTYDLTH